MNSPTSRQPPNYKGDEGGRGRNRINTASADKNESFRIRIRLADIEAYNQVAELDQR